MPMPLQKAQKVISEYRKAGFNASKGLVNAGYAKDSATKQSKKIIESALKKVTDEEIKKTVYDSSLSPRSKILQMVGMSEGELINEYMYIVKQNKDLTNKLKAMLPLLKTQGIVWEDSNTTVNPTLNLTVKTNTPALDHAQNISAPPADNVIDVVSSVSHEVEQSVDDIPSSFTGVDHVNDHAFDNVSSDVSSEIKHEVGQSGNTA